MYLLCYLPFLSCLLFLCFFFTSHLFHLIPFSLASCSSTSFIPFRSVLLLYLLLSLIPFHFTFFFSFIWEFFHPPIVWLFLHFLMSSFFFSSSLVVSWLPIFIFHVPLSCVYSFFHSDPFSFLTRSVHPFFILSYIAPVHEPIAPWLFILFFCQIFPLSLHFLSLPLIFDFSFHPS